ETGVVPGRLPCAARAVARRQDPPGRRRAPAARRCAPCARTAPKIRGQGEARPGAISRRAARGQTRETNHEGVVQMTETSISPAIPAIARRSGWSSGRVAPVVTGALLVLLALVLLGAGGTGMWAD